MIRKEYTIVNGYKQPMPLLEINLLGTKGRQKCICLLDSGATISVFHLSIAIDAGYEISTMRQEEIEFGGGKVLAYRSIVYLDVDGNRIKSEIYFTEKMTFRFNLLGRHTFFNKFNEVCFLERKASPHIELRF